MRVPVLAFLLLMSMCFASPVDVEGGNVTCSDLNATGITPHWAGIVGWMAPILSNPNLPISNQTAPVVDIYINYPNGTTYTNDTMLVVRDHINQKPNYTDLHSPTAADFDNGGMFSTFPIFLGENFTTLTDSPLNTFANPFATLPCVVGTQTYNCAYIYLQNHSFLGVLKFDNGTYEEPVFVTTIENTLGYNGTYFEFQYMVPANANYFFYIYPTECNITLFIDGVQTNIFPSTAVPYDVEILVTHGDVSSPINHAMVYVVEENGRNLLSPILSPTRAVKGQALMQTDASGFATYALTPTRYNIPNSYGYSAYVEVTSPSYCRADFAIASYSSLTPTYRTSLVNPSYESQVKSSVQNMNQLATTASSWISAGKYRNVTFNVTTGGSIEGTIPTLKAGAPNIFNITVKNGGIPVVANITVQETDGLIIFVPLQPDKLFYNDSGTFLSNETFLLIPTRYNNNANLTFLIDYGGTPVTSITFTVDSLLEPPTAAEANMGPITNALIASALQNVNQVLSNIGKSISTV